MFADSWWPKIPKTPHSSLNLSSMSGHSSHENSPNGIGPHALGLIDRHVNFYLARHRNSEPVSSGLANDLRGHPCLRRLLKNLGDVVWWRRNHHTGRRLAEESRGHIDPRVPGHTDAPERHLSGNSTCPECALGKRDGDAPVRTVVRRMDESISRERNHERLQRALRSKVQR